MTFIPNDPNSSRRSQRQAHSFTLFTCLGLVLATASICAQVDPSRSEQAARLHQQGLAQVRSGQVDEAIRTFRKGLEIAPEDNKLLDATGAAYSLKGDLETAQHYFLESLRVDPTSVPTRQNLGITQFSLGQFDAASAQFRTIQGASGKTQTVANLFLGLIAGKKSNCKTAVQLMESSGALLYQYPDALLSYSECQYELKNSSGAAQGLAAIERLPGVTPAQYLEASDLYSRLGQTQKAWDYLAKAQSPDAASAAITLKSAILLEKLNRLEEAQNLLEAQTSSQSTFETLSLLAKIARERGDFAVALKSLKHAAEIEPGREDSYLEFSTICADHGNDQLALDTAEIGLNNIPGSYRLTVQKGVVLEKLGHLNDAEGTLRKASTMQPDNSIALLSLAVVQAHSGKPDQAVRTLAAAIQKAPDNHYMYYFQGKLWLQSASAASGRNDLRERARRSFERAIQLNPNYADSYYQLSDLYLSAHPKLAEQALQKCLQLNPKHIPAQYSLARLYLRTGRKSEGEALLAQFKSQQRSEELEQQKQLRIEVAQN